MNNQIKNNQLPFNLITWLISVVPIVLIFSNAIADIIVVTASLFLLYDSFKKNYWKWLNEPWVKISIIIYFLTSQEFINEDSSKYRIIKLLNDEKIKKYLKFFQKTIQ